MGNWSKYKIVLLVLLPLMFSISDKSEEVSVTTKSEVETNELRDRVVDAINASV